MEKLTGFTAYIGDESLGKVSVSTDMLSLESSRMSGDKKHTAEITVSKEYSQKIWTVMIANPKHLELRKQNGRDMEIWKLAGMASPLSASTIKYSLTQVQHNIGERILLMWDLEKRLHSVNGRHITMGKPPKAD